MRFDVSDAAFRERAEQWLHSLDDGTLVDVEETFHRSPGYYPTTLIALWKQELIRRGLPTSSLNERNSSTLNSLPVCHPADYEWRFTEATARLLLEQASSSLERGECIVHVGTPTTFALGAANYQEYRHVLIERNAAVIAALSSKRRKIDEIAHIDLTMEEPPALRAAAAIVDPPWYLADTVIFLAASARACRIGARILLCQPTPATRPGIVEEREILLAELPGLGMDHADIQPSSVRYQMPHFEAMSLKFSIPDVAVPADWRTGDLVMLEKVGDTCHERQPRFTDEPWLDAQFGPVRIKLRHSAQTDLDPVVTGDVLDTVSRRDPVRGRVGFWTSGNRVYSLANPQLFADLLELCHHDVMRAEFTAKRTLEHAARLGLSKVIAQRLFDVLLVELQEHGLGKESRR